MAALAVGREEGLLAQLRALLFLPPSPAPAPAATTLAVKVESACGRPSLAAAIMTGSSGGRGPAAVSSSATAAADADAPSSCGGGGRQRRRRGSKRDRDEDDDDTELRAAQRPHYSPPPCCKRRKKKQQSSSKSIVTSVPDFDGYQWRKYGQKQIEGAMYPRSYYRCTLSAEQGCQAKRTVQRNDDDGGDTTATAEYTVVYMAEHTCTANDSPEAPVILETTTVQVAPSSAATNTHTDSIIPTTSAGSCSTTTTAASTSITTGTTESPAISVDDDITACWSSTSGASSDGYNNYAADDCYYDGDLFATAVHGGGWATGPPVDTSSLQEMEDLTGPIRSPVHVPVDGWTIDHLLLQLVNEHVCHF